MGDDVTRWQQDAHAAFTWIVGMYEQAETLWGDVSRYFNDAGWETSIGGGLGGVAMAQSDLSQWPFVYLKVLAALPKEAAQETALGTTPVFGILFYDAVRIGPVCFAGYVKWKDKPKGDHWALYDALTGYKDRFRQTASADAWIRCAQATAEGTKKRPNIEEVRWFELPLGGIAAAKRLKDIVEAAIEMAQGSDAEAIALRDNP